MKHRLLTATALGLSVSLLSATPTLAATQAELEARIAKLEEQINILTRQREIEAEQATAKAEKTPTIEMGKKGLSITSPDKQFSLKIRGYAQADGRFFLNDQNGDDTDTFLLRRVRPIIETTMGNGFSARIMPDFSGSSARIFDAHIDYALNPMFNFRAGKFKPPMGLERLQSASDIAFAERGLTASLLPNRDIGLQLYGEFIPEVLEYQLGVFNGNQDAGNTDSDSDDKKDVMARVFMHPFKNSYTLALQGLGIGISGSVGDREGSVTNTILPNYVTPGQATFFRYRTGTAVGDTTFADGSLYRLSPQGNFYYNSFGMLAEYVLSSQDVRRGAQSIRLDNDAWQVQMTYVLTGEDASPKGVKVGNPFDPLNGAWGAFEVAARYGRLNVDNDAFPFFANPANAASSADSWGIGFNWYFNDNAKFVLDYENTTFDGGATGSRDREDERVILSRVGYKF